ncbi:MAG: hypothetical protein M3046_15250 [Actinomycetota bacterium]|nr:hypothetical protein [Actinomycetota bacterium]
MFAVVLVGPLRAAITRVPTLLPAGLALGVILVLGYGLKDSGIAVPGMMLAVAVAAAVSLSAASLEVTAGSVSSVSSFGTTPFGR